MKDPILNRPWLFDDCDYRAVDLSGYEYYFRECPKMGVTAWIPKPSFSFMSRRAPDKIDRRWASENWARSLQRRRSAQTTEQ